MKKSILATATAILLGWGITEYWPVSIRISGDVPESDFFIYMPSRDKKRLDFFFRHVCFLHEWAYTLAGSKPMSIHYYKQPLTSLHCLIFHPDLKTILSNCFFPPSLREICYVFDPEQLKIKWGWETLCKYQKYFPHSRFFLYEEGPYNGQIALIIFDKVKILKTVAQYIGDFQKILEDENMDPIDLLENKKLYQWFKKINHEALIGTLLGFGRNNAWLFFNYQNCPIDHRPMALMWEEGQSKQAQLDEKSDALQPWEPSDLFYPLFVCDPQSEETKQLRQTYEKEREEIVAYYQNKDVVEATLNLFNRGKLSPSLKH